MSWRLLLHDPGLRKGVPFVVGTWAMALLIRVDLGTPLHPSGRSLGQLGGEHVALAFVFWFLCLWGVTTASVWHRSSLLNLSLPLTTRLLWTVRSIAAAAVGVAGVAAVTLAYALDLSFDPFSLTLEPGMLWLGMLGAATLLLVVVVLQLPFREVPAAPASVEYALYAGIIGLLAFVYLSAVPPGPITVLLPATAAALLAGHTYRSLPLAFDVAVGSPPPELAGPEPHATQPAARALPHSDAGSPLKGTRRWPPATSGRWVLHATLARCLVAYWLNVIYLPGLLIVGIGLAKDTHTGRNSLGWIVISLLWVVASFLNSVARTNNLAHLPISRRLLFRYTALPWVAALTLGLALYNVATAVSAHKPALIRVRDRSVLTPPAFWQIAWDGRVPEVATPWGESHRPTGIPLLPGQSPVLYDPFQVSPESSQRFAAFQLGRALRAAHRVPDAGSLPAFPPAPSNQRERREGVAVPASRGLPSAVQSKTIALGTIVLLVLGSLVIALSLGQYSSSARQALFRRLTLGCMTLLIAGLVVAFLAKAAGRDLGTLVTTVPYVITRLAAARLPVPADVLWAAAGVTACAAYFLVESVYLKTETPPRLERPDLLQDS